MTITISVCVSWAWGSQRTILCSRFLPSVFMWVLGTEFRVLGLGGKWFFLLHHLTGLVPLQLWALVLLGPLLLSDPSLQVQIYLVPGKSTAFPPLPFFLTCQLPLCSRCPHIVTPPPGLLPSSMEFLILLLVHLTAGKSNSALLILSAIQWSGP